MATKVSSKTKGRSRKKPVQAYLTWQVYQELAVEIEVQPGFTVEQVVDKLEHGLATVCEHERVISMWKDGEEVVLARLMSSVDLFEDYSSDFQAEAA